MNTYLRRAVWPAVAVVVVAGGLFAGIPLFSSGKHPGQAQAASTSAAPKPAAKEEADGPLWGKSCAQGPEGKQACFVFQTAVQKPQNIQLLEVQVGYLGPDGKPRLIVTIPLGTLVPGGVVIKIDDHPEFTAPIQTCVAAGCRVILDMDQSSFDDLRHGKQATMRFVTLQRQAIEIPVKLTGLAGALKSLAP